MLAITASQPSLLHSGLLLYVNYGNRWRWAEFSLQRRINYLLFFNHKTEKEEKNLISWNTSNKSLLNKHTEHPQLYLPFILCVSIQKVFLCMPLFICPHNGIGWCSDRKMAEPQGLSEHERGPSLQSLLPTSQYHSLPTAWAWVSFFNGWPHLFSETGYSVMITF